MCALSDATRPPETPFTNPNLRPPPLGPRHRTHTHTPRRTAPPHRKNKTLHLLSLPNLPPSRSLPPFLSFSSRGRRNKKSHHQRLSLKKSSGQGQPPLVSAAASLGGKFCCSPAEEDTRGGRRRGETTGKGMGGGRGGGGCGLWFVVVRMHRGAACVTGLQKLSRAKKESVWWGASGAEAKQKVRVWQQEGKQRLATQVRNQKTRRGVSNVCVCVCKLCIHFCV